MSSRTWLVASLLFGSGFCALVYQVVWLRELRLIFGASTMASAAVLAIFMGGLGFGSLLLGKRSDTLSRPLGFYAKLEFGIAATAAVTPILILLAGHLYILSGGTPALGVGLATSIRLVLSIIVLFTPTFLMGGTLPAASRAVGSDKDLGRRSVATLYGMNTLGGVTGILVPTFFLFERIGIHMTLWIACSVNVLVAFAASRISRGLPAQLPRTGGEGRERSKSSLPVLPPASFVLVAAAVVGFAFLVMELVWYRMLGPILGGTTYTFGTLLGIVLFGIGCGGILYAVFGRRRPATLTGLAITCTAEAFFFALPYGLGDRLALFALHLQPFAATGFGARVLVWTIITSIVVLPGAMVAGYQFPLLIGLLGRGRKAIGRQVGLGLASNTVGAIAGSLAGGFGLVQALTAPGTWRAIVWLLLGLGAVAILLSYPVEKRRRSLIPAFIALLLAIAMTTADGPSAAWRHTPIGAGRIRLKDRSPNEGRRWMNEMRRITIWEAEGKESSVALQSALGLSFLINGKSDGSAYYDAPTQVMYGLVGAILHPRPESALVIGLGTGSTAGWMAEIPSMIRVDVAELEPAIVEVSRACAPVNHNVLMNPKVKIFLGDGREMLLTSRASYDLIASEPSNPFRAGIASLFTKEFYKAVYSHLNSGGIFLQWIQAYEVDTRTILTVYSTLGSVFSHVETWQTAVGDLLLVCSADPISYDAASIRSRIVQEPYRSALARVWRVTDLEGFLSRFVANGSYARAVLEEESSPINTDDHPHVEFGFARSVGDEGLYIIRQIRETARSRQMHRPSDLAGSIDWTLVEDHRLAMQTLEQEPPLLEAHLNEDQRRRAEAQSEYLKGDLQQALSTWESREDPSPPRSLVEMALVADLLASAGRESVVPLIDQIRSYQPAEADILTATLSWRQGDSEAAASYLIRAFERCRIDPWPWPPLVERALSTAVQVAESDQKTSEKLFESLMEPFAVRQLDHKRQGAAMQIAQVLGPNYIIRAFERLEPHFIWQQDMLTVRAELYRASRHPYAEQASKDLETYLMNTQKASSE